MYVCVCVCECVRACVCAYARVCVRVCVKINNDELFLMLSRLKIHFILFLDMLRHGA